MPYYRRTSFATQGSEITIQVAFGKTIYTSLFSLNGQQQDEYLTEVRRPVYNYGFPKCVAAKPNSEIANYLEGQSKRQLDFYYLPANNTVMEFSDRSYIRLLQW